MSSASFGCQLTVVKRVSGDVSLIVKQSIDPKREVMSKVSRVSLTVQDKLHNSGTNVRVEERRLMEIESDWKLQLIQLNERKLIVKTISELGRG